MNKKRKILLTGASGFVGGNVLKYFNKTGLQVIGLSGPNSKEKSSFDITSLINCNEVINQISPDIVLHFAAISNSTLCEENQHLAYNINFLGTKNIATTCKLKKIKMIFISTDLVFEGAFKLDSYRFYETDQVLPVSYYSQTKCFAEKYILDNSIGDSLVVRIPLVYGPPIGNRWGFIGWIHDNLSKGKVTGLFTDEWRSPLYTEDLARYLSHIIDRYDFYHTNKIIHLAGRERISRFNFGCVFSEIFRLESNNIIPVTRGEAKRKIFRPEDVSMASKAFEYTDAGIEENLRDMLKKMS